MHWALWRHRNDMVWEGVFQLVNHIVNKAMDFFHERGMVRVKRAAAMVSSADQNYRLQGWQQPQAGVYNCNAGTTLFNSDNKYMLGVCIRTSTSSFFKSKTMWFNGTPTPQKVEAM